MIEALEDSVVYLLPYDKLMLLTEISWEINMFYRKILEYSLIVSQIKADSWRFETARERYSQLMEQQPEVIKRAPPVAHRLLPADDSRDLKPGTFGHTLIFTGNARTRS